jgi:hypothetical protein
MIKILKILVRLLYVAILLLCAFTPLHDALSFAWLLGYPAFFIALFIVLLYTFKVFMNKPTEGKPRWALATVVILLAAFTLVVVSRQRADSFADDIAVKVQNECDRQKTCSASIAGWERESDNVQFTYQGLTAKYAVKYIVHPDSEKKRFTIKVRHHIDGGYYIDGGVGRQLNRQYYKTGRIF